ncbi:MAG: L-serine ammonia-lyase, iron-sulfur-dependent, subunit alpha [Candidatus Cloacimonetes bacterium]|nr:L-serine ammonia-lyase, iron-sulfur-dependent, subunit alpha [Candidatus Cloacimonadota bacterium]
MLNYGIILDLLKQEVVPAMGCTEPAAVALAAAYAADVLPGDILQAIIKVSPAVLKNGMGVGIPGTGLIGLEIAAALGLVVADPRKELQVLADVSEAQIDQAKALLEANKLSIDLHASDDKVYIEVLANDGIHHARAVIRWRHSWLHRLELDGQVLKYQELGDTMDKALILPTQFSLRDYYDFSESVSYEELLQIDLGEKINRLIADYGLAQSSGISVGKMLMQQIEDGLLGNDMHHYAMALTAAATDARMSGCTLPVISNTGSGNQGLSITLPIIAVAEKLDSPHEATVRALALGHLVSVHIKAKIGVLSCLCGCLSAAAGAACGIVMLLGGDYEKVEYAIKNMIGNTAGMVCDGAKEGCSLKVATNTSAAVQAALLANMGKCISANDGIITDDIDETIDNLARFVNSGMENADSTILSIMLNKKNHKEEKHVH